MMKKIMLMMGIILCAGQANAAAIASGDDCAAEGSTCHWEIDENGKLTITGSGAMKENFGNTLREDNTKVDSGATTNASWGNYFNQITSIEIGEGITDTGARSFQGLGNVTSVTIPSTLTTIGAFAFDRQPDLVNFNVPDNNNLTNFSGNGAFQFSSSLTNESAQKVLDAMAANNKNNNTMFDIPYNTFNQSNLTSISIPEGVNEIGTQAFWGQKITSVDIPEGVTSIGDYAFSTATLESITLPSTLESIGSTAFYGNNLTSVDIPEGVTSIGQAAFRNNKLTEVNIPEGVTSIGNTAFYGQKGIIDENGKWVSPLKSVTLPDTLTEIGDYAFHSHGLTELIIPDSVTTIGVYAFNGLASTEICDRTIYDCYSDTLKTIYIPESVTNIGEGAFKSNRALDEIVLDANVDTSGWSQDAFMDMPKNLTIRCLGDVTKCEEALARYRSPNCEGTWACLVNPSFAPITSEQCNRLSKYYYNGESCEHRPEDGVLECAAGFYTDHNDYCDKMKLRYTIEEANNATSNDNENTIEWIFE